jgi:hypothetical protein
MGWWRSAATGRSLLPPGDPEEIGVVGDEVADIMDVALRKIAVAYRETWHRAPTDAELEALWKFCRGRMKEDLG